MNRYIDSFETLQMYNAIEYNELMQWQFEDAAIQ